MRTIKISLDYGNPWITTPPFECNRIKKINMLTVDENANIRVSSVLNRDVKQFGKKYMFDDNEETCWNSDQGSPQWIHIDFVQPVIINELHLIFQGGFVGKECYIEGSTGDSQITKILDFYPEDVNSLQIFKIPGDTVLQKVRVIFNTSTDFFGRITIYKMNLIGNKI